MPYLLMLFPLDPIIEKIANSTFVLFFIFLSYCSHLALLTLLIIGSTTLLTSLLFIKIPVLIRFITLCIATLLVFSLFTDVFVFTSYRFHLNAPLLQMLFSGKAIMAFGFSTMELLFIVIIFIFFFLIEFILSVLVWRYIVLAQRWHSAGIFISLSLMCSLLFSYTMYVFSLEKDNNFLTQQTKVLPFYEAILATLLPFDDVQHLIENHGNKKFAQLKQTRSPLYYPQKNMHCNAVPANKKMNFVWIVIDSWRFDALSTQLTPNISEFAKTSWQFTQHVSGGNSTQAGLFSLFYSLPSTYWTSVLEQKKSPIFTQVLREQGYQLAAFSSNTLETPPLNKTIFRDMHFFEDKFSGQTPIERDQQLSQTAIQFIKNIQQPFFAFLFYDAAHSFCSEQTFVEKFQPAVNYCTRMMLSKSSDPTPYYNRYRNAIHFIDNEIKRVIAELQKADLLKNTVIILTGDHGQEFNDNQQHYWEHASNYTKFQIQTPLIIHWPNTSPRSFTHTTTHYDIVPTLLQQLFACQNSSQDYSIGHNLLNETSRFPIIAGSYINFAILEPKQTTLIYPSGTLEVQDNRAKHLPNAVPNEKSFQEVLKLIRKFYTVHS